MTRPSLAWDALNEALAESGSHGTAALSPFECDDGNLYINVEARDGEAMRHLVTIRVEPSARGKFPDKHHEDTAYLSALRTRFPTRFRKVLDQNESFITMRTCNPIVFGAVEIGAPLMDGLRSLVAAFSEVQESVSQLGEYLFESTLSIKATGQTLSATTPCPRLSWFTLYSEALLSLDEEVYGEWCNYERSMVQPQKAKQITPAQNAFGVATLAVRLYFGLTLTSVTSGDQRELTCTLIMKLLDGKEVEIRRQTSTTKKDAIRTACLGAIEEHFPYVFEEVKKLSWYTPISNVDVDIETCPTTINTTKVPGDSVFHVLKTFASRGGMSLELMFRTVDVGDTQLHGVEVWNSRKSNADVPTVPLECIVRCIATSKVDAVHEACLLVSSRILPDARNDLQMKIHEAHEEAGKTKSKRTPEKIASLENDDKSALKTLHRAIARAARAHQTTLHERVVKKDRETEFILYLGNGSVIASTTGVVPLQRLRLQSYYQVLMKTDFCSVLPNLASIRAFLKLRSLPPVEISSCSSPLAMFEYGSALKFSVKKERNSMFTGSVLFEDEIIAETSKAYRTEVECHEALNVEALMRLIPEVYGELPGAMRGIEEEEADLSYLPRPHGPCALERMRVAVSAVLGHVPRERHECFLGTVSGGYTITLEDTLGTVLYSCVHPSPFEGLYSAYIALMETKRFILSRNVFDGLSFARPYKPESRATPETIVEYALQYRFGLKLLTGSSALPWERSMSDAGDKKKEAQWTTRMECQGCDGTKMELVAATVGGTNGKAGSVRACSKWVLERHFPDLAVVHEDVLSKFPLEAKCKYHHEK